MSTDLAIEIFSHFIIVATFIIFARKRFLTYLHAFQQEEYDSPRLSKWIMQHGVYDKKISLGLLIATIAWALPHIIIIPGFYIPSFVTNFLTLGALALGVYWEKDPRYESKKKLSMTNRAVRIQAVSMLLLILVTAAGAWLRNPLYWLVAVQSIPWIMMLGNMMLSPFENFMQNKYWGEAHDKLKQLQPITIGITGSFGKTSVKHILGHILSMNAKTLITPGSVNTPMGIARIIREQLDEDHKYFICEMGAYGPGSIARLCKLAPPDISVITAIGHAHYERFKTLDAVAKTKYEIAQAAIAKGGKVIINEKTLEFEDAENVYNAHYDNFILCSNGVEKTGDLRIERTVQTLQGLEVTIVWEEKGYVLKAPLFGIHHGDNMAYAFATACQLGLSPDTIITALSSVPQINHRLEVKTQPNGAMVIDDAFNSNPLGFRSALDLLETLSAGGKRSILVTPGMVELGALHDEVHKQIGTIAAEKCDIVIAVNPKRIPTFTQAFRAKKDGAQELHEFDTFYDAEQWVAANMNEKDVILIENDLPDLYERVPRL